MTTGVEVMLDLLSLRLGGSFLILLSLQPLLQTLREPLLRLGLRLDPRQKMLLLPCGLHGLLDGALDLRVVRIQSSELAQRVLVLLELRLHAGKARALVILPVFEAGLCPGLLVLIKIGLAFVGGETAWVLRAALGLGCSRATLPWGLAVLELLGLLGIIVHRTLAAFRALAAAVKAPYVSRALVSVVCYLCFWILP